MKNQDSPKELYNRRQYAEVIRRLEPSYPFSDTPEDLERLRLIAQSYFAEKKFEQATQAFLHYIELDEKLDSNPNSTPPPGYLSANRIVLAFACADHGQMSVAETIFRDALVCLKPSDKMYQRQAARLANLYARSNDPNASGKVNQILHEVETASGLLSPQSVAIRRELAGIFIKNKQLAEGESLFQNLIKSFSGSAQTGDLANALCWFAEFQFRVSMIERAEAPLLQALAIRKMQTDDRNLYGKTLEHLQILYEKLGNASKITSLFEETAQEANSANSLEVNRKRAAIFARAKNFAACEDELKLAIDELKSKADFPFYLDLLNAKYCLGQIYFSQNNLAEATKLFEEVSHGMPKTSVSVVVGASTTPAESKRLRKVWEDFCGIQRSHEPLPRSCEYLSAAYAKQARFADAAAVLQTEIEHQRKDNPKGYWLEVYLNKLAWIYLKQERYDKALRTLNESADASDDDLEKNMALLGNKALIIEAQGGDASGVIVNALKYMRSGDFIFDDPVADFAMLDEYADFGEYLVSGYQTLTGERRLEPSFGWNLPPLVLYYYGDLGAKNFALFPDEHYLGDEMDPEAPKDLQFIEWSFGLPCTGERYLTMAQIRLGDIYVRQQKFSEAEEAFVGAMKDGENERVGPDGLKLAYERMISLYNFTNRQHEAKKLELRVKTLPSK